LLGDTCNFNGRVGTVEDVSFDQLAFERSNARNFRFPTGPCPPSTSKTSLAATKSFFSPTLGLRFEIPPISCVTCSRNAGSSLRTSQGRDRLGAIRFAVSSKLSLGSFQLCFDQGFRRVHRIREIFSSHHGYRQRSWHRIRFPSRTLYLGKDSGLDPERTVDVAKKVEQWREEKQLPFPDFAQTEITQFRDTLPYPDPASAVNDKKW
jgi:MscS family membrane protein